MVSKSQTVGTGDLDPKTLDSILSDELAQLSMQDRETLNEQLHGISSSPSNVETPAMLEGAVTLMASEIDFCITPHNKKAYLLATTDYRDSTYVHDKDFRLRFIRCD